ALDASRTEEMRRAAVRALGEVGAPARPAVPQLRLMLRDNNAETRQTAEEALYKIEGEAAGQEKAPPEPETVALPEAERKYRWEIEHHGNRRVKHGFVPLAEALRRADAAALSGLLADDFRGADLGEPRRVRSATGDAEVERLEDAGREPVPLGRDGFVA